MDIGASGGYYVAVAADKIVVHPSSVTGSVGVIMMTLNARGLLEKIGLEANAVTSGPKKDMGSPFRAMTDEERGIFQGLITSFYERFLTVVKEGRRNLSSDEIRKMADGRIYTGEQASALGLVDHVGYLDDAIELAKRDAGLKEARVVMYRRPGEYRHNIYSQFLGGGNSLSGLVTWTFCRWSARARLNLCIFGCRDPNGDSCSGRHRLHESISNHSIIGRFS